MISLIACWALLGAIALAWGVTLLRIGYGQFGDAADDGILAIWIGTLWLGAAMLALALVVPLRPMILGLAGLLGGILAFRHRRGFPSATPPTAAWVTGVAALTVSLAWLGSEPPTLYDSGVYHLGAIRWLADHGTVPGLALLHNRFGFPSSVFALTASFDHGPWRSRMSNAAVGLMVLLVLVHAGIAWARLIARRARAADVFAAVALLPAVAYAAGGLSPSPDLPALAVTALVGWSALRVEVEPVTSVSASRLGDPRLAPALLAAAATALKLSALPLLGVVGAWYVFGRRDVRTILARAALMALPLLAVVATGLVGTGCPLYPAPLLCSDLPWSLGGAEARSNSAYIRSFARWDGRLVPSSETMAGWIGPWVQRHVVTTALIVLSLVLAAIVWRRARTGGERIVVGTAIAGMLYGLVSAPAPRFLLGYAVLIPALAVAKIVAGRPGARPARPEVVGALFAAGSLLAAALLATASVRFNVGSMLRGGALIPRGADAALVRPIASASPPLWRLRSNDVEYFTPVDPAAGRINERTVIDPERINERCWTAPLPCTPYLGVDAIRLRNAARGLRAGFVRAAAPDR